jgi:LPS export ABC transporter protein LptC
MAFAYDSGDTGRDGAPPPSNDRRGARAGRGAGVVVGTDQKSRDKAFRVARRHSFLVRAMRWLLPLVSIGAIASVGLLVYGQIPIGDGSLKPGKVEITAEDLKMKNPSYFGVSKEGDKYEVRAREAAVDFAQTGPIKLLGIEGDLLQKSGVVTKLTAGRGLLDRAKNELELFDKVTVDATNGMRVRTKRAMIYQNENRVTSSDPVTADMPAGSLVADKMDLLTKTRAGTFEGNVRLRLVQTANASTGQQGKAAPNASIGLGKDAKQPVDIRADRLDVNDTAHTADFKGNVAAVQGETALKAAEMHIAYQGRASIPGLTAGEPKNDADQASAISRIVAKTGVVITAGLDRRVASDVADFDVKADTALLTGNVQITQAKNQMRGRRLSIDRKAGKMHLDAPAESGVGAGRIAATFYQQAADTKAGSAATKPAAEAPGMLSSFKNDPNAPVDVEAESLDVSDTQKLALFRGAVRARQGDVTIQSAELHVTYAGQTGILTPTSATDDAAPKAGAGAQLSKIEAKTKVVITSKDGQEAIGEWATFDTKANTMLMGGPNGVQLRQGQNVTVGTKLRVNLTNGEAQLINDASTAAVPNRVVPGGSAAAPQGAACPPGKQCLLVYPKDLQDAQKQKTDNVPEKQRVPAIPKVSTDGWSSGTLTSPPPRSK